MSLASLASCILLACKSRRSAYLAPALPSIQHRPFADHVSHNLPTLSSLLPYIAANNFDGYGTSMVPNHQRCAPSQRRPRQPRPQGLREVPGHHAVRGFAAAATCACAHMRTRARTRHALYTAVQVCTYHIAPRLVTRWVLKGSQRESYQQVGFSSALY